MARVFVVGMAVVDFVFQVDAMPTEPIKYRAKAAKVVGGGCAATAAVAIARLGGRVTLATRLGDDPVGDMILAELEREGVDMGFAHRGAGARSSFSSILVDAAGERQIVNFRGEGLIETTDWLDAAPQVDAVLVDNRWSDGASAALDLARRRGIPGVIDAEDPVDPDVLSHASHVAFSRQGLEHLVPGEPLRDALATAAARFGGWTCVTDGAEGVAFTDGAATGHVPAFPVDVVDTLGAGDIWHGAFALRLAEGADAVEAARFANAAAALKCTRFGGRAGCPTRAETDAFLRDAGS